MIDRRKDVALRVDVRGFQWRQWPVFERACSKIRKVHEVLGVVIARPGEHIVVAAEAQAPHQCVEHVVWHASIVDQAYRIPELALFQTARERIDQTLGDAFTKLELGIARELEGERLGMGDRKYTLEHLGEAGADDVVEHHDHLPPRLRAG